MIIFDLDGTLADCEHRRHFVDPMHAKCELMSDGKWYYADVLLTSEPPQRKRWRPDWRSFYESCSEDLPNERVLEILRMYTLHKKNIEIWSGRCESVREKTVNWLVEHAFWGNDLVLPSLKMRPKGNSIQDDILKEQWLDEHLASGGKPIQIVFDDRQKVVDMWRRRGITCLQVAQGDF